MPRQHHGRASLLLLPGLLVACALPTPIGQLARDDTESTSTGPPPTTSSTDSDGASVTSLSTMTETTSDTDMVGPFPMHAWVMRYEDYLEMEPDGGTSAGGTSAGGTTAGGTGSGPAPDTLIVQISTGPDDCDDPWAGLQCGEQWEISLLIPALLQAPGTYQISEDLNGFWQSTGPDEFGDICSGGGGTLEGLADLTVVSEQEVSGQLSMTDAFDFDADVTFTALGCS